MMWKRKRVMKGESGATLYYLLVFQAVMLIFFAGFATMRAEINCPDLSTASGSTLNTTDPNVTQTNYLSWLNVMTGSCSGLPWWIWIVVFLPSILTIILIVLPNWLSGA